MNAAHDLSQATTWHGLQPGMLLTEAVAAVQAGGQEKAYDPEDPLWIMIPEWGLDVHSTEEEPHRVWQLVLSDPTWHWHGQPLLGEPLHTVLERLGEHARAAGWRPEFASDPILGSPHEGDLSPVADEELLNEGTLWLPALRWGLILQHGRVRELVWREARDIPQKTVGGVTERQRELSRRPDAEEYLRRYRAPGRRRNWLQVQLTGVFVLALIGIVVYAAQEHAAWSSAPTAQAEVLAVRRAGADEKVRVRFVDQYGAMQEAERPRAEWYLSPLVGSTAEVRYLNMQPIRVHGPAAIGDVAFTRAVPRVAMAVGAYTVLFGAASWWRRRQTRA